MLNISEENIRNKISVTDYRSFCRVYERVRYKIFNRLLISFHLVLIILLFLPWTQNIGGKGNVTTLQPNQRPQTVQSPIPGKIEKWFVREGQFVKVGDTLLFISEIKSEYLDPKLLERTEKQLNAKIASYAAYEEKIKAYEGQLDALIKNKAIKIQQTKGKSGQSKLQIQSDSIDYIVANNNLNIAQTQYDRTLLLFNEGIKSKADLENKSIKLAENKTKFTSKKNKFEQSKNKFANAFSEIERISQEYNDKINKIKSAKYEALSGKFETETQIEKLKNKIANYSSRAKMKYITAPQTGFINKAIIGGLGETIKAGQQLVSIMPKSFDLAVEAYIDPVDMPLVHLGELVQIQFDGWPAIFFSGWPNASYGTFQGEIVAIQDFISENKKFRILIAPSKNDRSWPDNIKVGAGARTIALLNDVPIWYELFRKLNGFPPDYYNPTASNKKSDKKKESK